MNTRRTHVINLIMDAATRTLRRGARAAVWSLMAVMMWSCASDEPTPEPNPGDKPDTGAQVRQIEIKAVIGTDGRGGSDDVYGRVGAEMDYEAQSTHFSWEKDDVIGVYTTDPKNAVKFTITSIDDGVATLTGEMALKEGDTLYGVYPFVTSDALMLTQDGTLDGVGKCLLMTADATTYKENEGITMKFQHETALMTFNLTFPQDDVTKVTDICLENTQSKFSITSSGGVTVEGSEPIKIAGPLKPDSEGKLALHVVLLPGSEFNKFNLTCTTDQGDYRMPPMSSTNKSVAGKHHRTSRTMALYSPYEMAVVTTGGTSTAVEDIQHDHGKIKWFEDASLTAGTMITVCNVGVWKCFHALTDADIAQRYVVLPDMNGGCTLDSTDPTRNDWIVALCLGGNVATKINPTGVDKPLYWATGNLIAIAQEDGSAKFRLATLDEMENWKTKLPLFHRPIPENRNAGDMWDLFLYGDPSGLKLSSGFKYTPTSSTSYICGDATKDIARAVLKYSWRLPYVPKMISSSDTDMEAGLATNELRALTKCTYAGANSPALDAGWLTYGSNLLFFPLAGTYYSGAWQFVEQTGFFMTGNVINLNGTVTIIITPRDKTFDTTYDPVGVTGSAAMMVRPVTD